MRVGIDTYSFDTPGENSGVGPGVYVWKLLPELFRVGSDHHFVVFSNSETHGLIPRLQNVTKVVSPGPNRLRPYRILHEQIYLPIQFWRYHLDMMHFLGNNISYILARKSILTVYDLMWDHYIQRGESDLKYRYFRMTVPLSLRKAKGLITISRHVAHQVEGRFRGTAEGVYPIYLAPGSLSEPSEEKLLVYRGKYSYPFIFAVTTSMPHKNLGVLLQAFMKLKQDSRFGGKLVVAGQLKGASVKATEEFIQANNLAGDVVLAGFISEEEKTFCYRNSEVFVYPSLYEGFGLPILEAMQSGAPVVASNAASMPEVGGDACLYFNPYRVEELVSSLLIILNDAKQRKLCIAKGHERVRLFSWTETATQTLKVYEKIFLDTALPIANLGAA